MENQEKILKTLESIGLSKNESIIYLDLIMIGSSSAGDISKRTKIHRSNVYDHIDNLIKKGIITQTIMENRRVFHPVKPKDLRGFLKQKEEDLSKIIPEIEKIHNKPKEIRKVVVMEGIASIRNLFTDLIESEKPISFYVLPKEIFEIMGGFLELFTEKRIKRKIMLKGIYNLESKKIIRDLTKSRFEKFQNYKDYTEIRFLPSSYDTKITTGIHANKIIIIFWENPISAIVIENESLARAYEKNFELLWEQSKMFF